MAVRPDSLNVVFTGGYGPAYEFAASISRDSGTTWTRFSLSGTGYGFCHALEFAPSRSRTVYAGGEVLGAGAVYRSTDGGATWARTASAPADTIFELAVQPNDPDRVLAATPSGLFVTADGGTSWSLLNNTTGSRAVAFHPAGPETLVCAGDSGAAISRDRGLNWSPMNVGLEGQVIRCLDFVEYGGWHLLAGTRNGACYAWQFSTGIAGLDLKPRPGLRVVPNPFVSTATVPGHEREVFVVYDTDGRRVGMDRGARIGAGLPAGVYFVNRSGSDPVRIVKTR